MHSDTRDVGHQTWIRSCRYCGRGVSSVEPTKERIIDHAGAPTRILVIPKSKPICDDCRKKKRGGSQKVDK